uniref:Proteolipid protein 2 n=1 Tax=Geospiza parvula TaxID=87175 RepID=A0A8C3QBM4_GEOPR
MDAIHPRAQVLCLCNGAQVSVGLWGDPLWIPYIPLPRCCACAMGHRSLWVCGGSPMDAIRPRGQVLCLLGLGDPLVPYVPPGLAFALVCRPHTGYLGLAVVELVVAILVLLAWSYHLPQRMQMLHWAWSDFTRCVIGAVLFLIFSLIVIISHYDGAGIVGGVFGLLAGILMGYDAYITFPLWQGHTAAPTESPGGA